MSSDQDNHPNKAQYQQDDEDIRPQSSIVSHGRDSVQVPHEEGDHVQQQSRVGEGTGEQTPALLENREDGEPSQTGLGEKEGEEEVSHENVENKQHINSGEEMEEKKGELADKGEQQDKQQVEESPHAQNEHRQQIPEDTAQNIEVPSQSKAQDKQPSQELAQATQPQQSRSELKQTHSQLEEVPSPTIRVFIPKTETPDSGEQHAQLTTYKYEPAVLNDPQPQNSQVSLEQDHPLKAYIKYKDDLTTSVKQGAPSSDGSLNVKQTRQSEQIKLIRKSENFQYAYNEENGDSVISRRILAASFKEKPVQEQKAVKDRELCSCSIM